MSGGDSVTDLRFRGADGLKAALSRSLLALTAMRLPPADHSRLAIMIEELLANLFEHGRTGPNSVIVLRLVRHPDHVQLVLEDGGPSFDPAAADLEAPIPERGGGAGLALVRAWAEQLSYAAGAELNRLELRYSLTPADD
jgi:serine/threonine-protein kinase RsbW